MRERERRKQRPHLMNDGRSLSVLGVLSLRGASKERAEGQTKKDDWNNSPRLRLRSDCGRYTESPGWR